MSPRWLIGFRTFSALHWFLISVSGDAGPVTGGTFGWTSDWARYETFFGHSIQTTGGFVSHEEFSDFLRLSVAPRFPDGYTVFQGRGQWASAVAGIVSENSTSLVVFAEASASSMEKLSAICEEYKEKFQQEAVLVSISESQACFAGSHVSCLSEAANINPDRSSTYLSLFAAGMGVLNIGLLGGLWWTQQRYSHSEETTVFTSLGASDPSPYGRTSSAELELEERAPGSPL